MARFPYGRYFGEIEPLADALREGATRCWSAAVGRDPAPRDHVLSLGCNVLRTVNLAETTVAILRAMGADFIALGGPANCCGFLHDRNGDGETAGKLLRHTLDNVAAFRPKSLLTYCPACHAHLDEKAAQGLALPVPYLHVTEFLAGHLERLRFVRRVERKVGLHTHLAEPQTRKDAAAAMTVLRAIPGLEVVELPVGAEWERQCSPQLIERLGAARYGELAGRLFDEARARGLDALVTLYHSCYRQLCPREADHGLELINYVELVAEGLGLPPRRSTYKALAQEGSPDRAYEALRRTAVVRGVSLQRLREAVRSHFTRGG